MATNFHDRIGQRLDDSANVPPEFAHLVPDDRQRVSRILEFPVSGRVLDVGCSDGAITKRIAAKWPIDLVIGVDSNRRNYEGGLRRVEFIQHDIREPISWVRSNQTQILFDAIFACEVFEHLTDADATKALQNICAVLKPGGDLIVTVPNRYPNDLYEVGMRSRWAWPDHRSAWSLEKLADWLHRHGFPIKDMAFRALYDGEKPQESIWLIVRARARR